MPGLELKMCGEKWRIVYCLQHTYPKAAKAALSHKMLHFFIVVLSIQRHDSSLQVPWTAAVFSNFGSAYFPAF